MMVCITVLITFCAQAAENVIIVVMDGVRYTETFGLPDTDHPYEPHEGIPNLFYKLAPLGTVCNEFYNAGGYTWTVPGHTTMLTGCYQYVVNDGRERPHMPTIFEYYNKQNGIQADIQKIKEETMRIKGAIQNGIIPEPEHLEVINTNTWVVAEHGNLKKINYSDKIGYGKRYGASIAAGFGSWNDGNADERAAKFLKWILDTYHPKLVMVNFGDTDHFGHTGIWKNKNEPRLSYVEQIKEADKLIWALWEYVEQDSGYGGKTVMFVTNDHGRCSDKCLGFSTHGCKAGKKPTTCIGSQRCMFLAVGPDIKTGYVSTESWYHLPDIATTTAYLLKFIPAIRELQLVSAGDVMVDILKYPPEDFSFTLSDIND